MSIFRTIPYAALSATLLAAGGASAQSMGSIDAREDRQQYRIDQGIRDGSLTTGEASRLERGEQRIMRYEDRARADGTVSPYERQRLDNMLDREGHSINRESHDGQRADGRGWGERDGSGRGGWGGDRDGWRRDGDRDGWRRDADGHNGGWGRDRDGWNNGNQNGWNRGEHNGWDGNRQPGFERRDAQNEQRTYNGVRNGSVSGREFGQLERGQQRIDQYESRAGSDGNFSSAERNRINGMQNRETRQIYADTHNERGMAGFERRDAQNEQRIYNGVRNGSVSGREFGQLERGQQRIDQYESRAGSDGNFSSTEHNRINGMQNRETRQIYADSHNERTAPTTGGTQPTSGSHSWGNGGWQHAPQTGSSTATTPTSGTSGSHNWGNGGWQHAPQTGGTAPTMPSTQPSGGTHNWGGGHTQQASATPTMQRPTMTRASAPAPAPASGGRSWGGRH